VLVIRLPRTVDGGPPLVRTDRCGVGVANAIANIVVIAYGVEGFALEIVGAALE
jgi:hypothetical protein